MRLILASNSPRRKELMQLITGDFEIEVADIDERAIEESMAGGNPLAVSEALALAKAQAVFSKNEDAIVIGADTSVVLGREILGKPESREDARRMLFELSGKTHIVVTGVALVSSFGTHSFSEEARVIFNDLDSYQEALIERYCDSPDPYDKAGAYGIQSGGALLVRGIDGDFFNVVGLPVARLARELENFTKGHFN